METMAPPKTDAQQVQKPQNLFFDLFYVFIS